MSAYFSKMPSIRSTDLFSQGRIAIAAVLIAAMAAGSALAQAPKPPGRAAAAPVEGECAVLPGGKAPAAKIADVKGALAPRDLDLVYFGKPLAELQVEDFERIAELSPKCGVRDGVLTPEKLKSFEAAIRASQQIRRTALDTVERQKKEIAALPAGRERLLRLNALSDRMTQLESELTRSDVDTTVKWIVRQTQAVYDARPKSEATLAVVPVARDPAPVVEARPVAPPPAGGRVPGREDER